jgi:hypothetical protein
MSGRSAVQSLRAGVGTRRTTSRPAPRCPLIARKKIAPNVANPAKVKLVGSGTGAIIDDEIRGSRVIGCSAGRTTWTARHSLAEAAFYFWRAEIQRRD